MRTSKSRRQIAGVTAALLLLLVGGLMGPGATRAAAAGPQPPSGTVDVRSAATKPPTSEPQSATATDWLEEINIYRQAAGLSPVTNNPAWTTGIKHHNTYLAKTPASYLTGAYASAHTENPASPYYTPDGSAAAGSTDIYQGAVGWSPVEYIDGWLSAPFHAIGMLRPGLTQVAFAADKASGNAGLDVIRGITSYPTVAEPILFPGPGMRTNLVNYSGGESPSPLETCGWSTNSYVGLPIIAMLPQPPVAGLKAQVTSSDGAVQSTSNAKLCAVDQNTYHSSDPVYGPTGKAILTGDNAVLLIARAPYTWGRQHVTIDQPGQPEISWSFITAPPGQLSAGKTYTLHVSDGAATILANLTATASASGGYVTAYPCGKPRPVASNLNMIPGKTVANFVVTRSDANGDICLYTSATTHLLWDQASATTAFDVSTAQRLLDTRVDPGARAAAGSITKIHAATGAATVLANLTVTGARDSGYTTVYPCTQPRPHTSNSNFIPGKTVANFVVTHSDANGDICLYTSATTHLLWDQAGATTAFNVSTAQRLLDTRTQEPVLG